MRRDIWMKHVPAGVPPLPPRGAVVLSSCRSRTRAMEALRHEHFRVLVGVNGKAIWIRNVLVDATRHHGETADHNRNGGPKQRLRGPSFKERDWKGSISGDWPIGAASCRQRNQPRRHATPPPPPFELFCCGEAYTSWLWQAINQRLLANRCRLISNS